MSRIPGVMPFLLALLMGFFAGLRSVTAPAAVAWGAHLGWLSLPSPFAWIGTTTAVVVLSVLALAELVADKLPSTPSRTDAPGLGARIAMSAFAGGCAASAGGQPVAPGALLGMVGAIAGTFGGYQARTGLVQALGTPDFVVALVEDLVAVGGSLWTVSRF
jgi:uncharacterized membrane protein